MVVGDLDSKDIGEDDAADKVSDVMVSDKCESRTMRQKIAQKNTTKLCKLNKRLATHSTANTK